LIDSEGLNASTYNVTDGQTDRQTDDIMIPIADHTE